MNFIIHDDFWRLFPAARIGVVVAHGLDNRHTERADIAELLSNAASAAAARLGDSDIATHPAVAPWRQAYRAFGAKPAQYRSSIESLLRSARAQRIHPINPLVDLYNTISLRAMLPCGGEDLATLQGDIHLALAAGDEHFVALGGSQPEPPQPGEVIYRDELGVICRCWNWREADRSKLTPATTAALLCIEALPPTSAAELQEACVALATLVREKLGATATLELLDRSRPTIRLTEV